MGHHDSFASRIRDVRRFGPHPCETPHQLRIAGTQCASLRTPCATPHQLRKAEYAMCVASDPMWATTSAFASWIRHARRFGPHVGHHTSFASWVRHARRFRPSCGPPHQFRKLGKSLQTPCETPHQHRIAEYAMCVFSVTVWAISMRFTPCLQMTSCTQPERGEERWRARRGCGGELGEGGRYSALAGAHSQHRGPPPPQQKEHSETHSHLSPSIVHDGQSDETFTKRQTAALWNMKERKR